MLILRLFVDLLFYETVMYALELVNFRVNNEKLFVKGFKKKTTKI